MYIGLTDPQWIGPRLGYQGLRQTMTKTIILPHSHYDADHFELVKAEMQVLGAPTVKVIDCGEHYVALEGAHRLRAAAELDLIPVLDMVEYDPDAETDDVVPGSYQDNWTLDRIVSRAHESTPLYFDKVEVL